MKLAFLEQLLDANYRRSGLALVTDLGSGEQRLITPRLTAGDLPLSDEEEATVAALQQDVDDIETASAEAEELTDEQDQRMGELETAIEALNARPIVFDADEVVRAGAFVSIAADGSLRIERGYVRPEDELPIEPEVEAAGAIAETSSSYDVSLTADVNETRPSRMTVTLSATSRTSCKRCVM